jgi:protein SCO1/2
MRSTGNLFAQITLVLALLLSPSPPARALDVRELKGVTYEQKLGAFVPLDVRFRDDHGKEIRLGDLFENRPILLVLGYYQCPMLCTLTGSGLVGALSGMKSEPGEAFGIIWISIDSEETPQMAALKKESYFKHYGRGTADGWHFLTGKNSSIRKVANAVGFRYRYDPEIRQYAHASGIVVLTPQGQVSKYLLGINYPSETLQEAILNAAKTKVGSLTNQLLLLCYHFSPIVGKYGWLIVWIVRGLGVVTVLCIAATVVHLVRRERKEGPA